MRLSPGLHDISPHWAHRKLASCRASRVCCITGPCRTENLVVSSLRFYFKQYWRSSVCQLIRPLDGLVPIEIYKCSHYGTYSTIQEPVHVAYRVCAVVAALTYVWWNEPTQRMNQLTDGGQPVVLGVRPQRKSHKLSYPALHRPIVQKKCSGVSKHGVIPIAGQPTLLKERHHGAPARVCSAGRTDFG